jgi:regulator of protease activity HflC (stomatin/prohibitin superfamily)
VITFRVIDPLRLAERVDFTIDLRHGRWQQTPLEQVAGLLTQLAQQFVIDDLARRDLRTVLTDGVAPIRDRIATGLAGENAVADLGLEVVAVRVAAVTPTAELEKALQQPTTAFSPANPAAIRSRIGATPSVRTVLRSRRARSSITNC